jgi:hypothetical protein
MTPSIDFAMDPETGASGEQDFHARAQEGFTEVLEKMKPLIERNLEAIRSGFPTVVPFDPGHTELNEFELDQPHPGGPFRMGVMIGYPDSGLLEISLREAPSPALYEALKARARELFSETNMGPSQTGAYYRLTLGYGAEFSIDAETGARTAPVLANFQERIEGKVSALAKELNDRPGLVPFDPSYPVDEPWDEGSPRPSGPVRVVVHVEQPGPGATLELALRRAPTEDQLQVIDRRAREAFSHARWST